MKNLSREQLERRLDFAERALERCDRLATASRYASAIMHEVNNPLEAITNLVYLTKLQLNDQDRILENMNIVEGQLEILSRVTRQSLAFHREQTELSNLCLGDIAEAVLKLHSEKIIRHGIKIEQRIKRPSHVLGLGSEMLQVVSNLILNALDALPLTGGRLCLQVGTTSRGAFLTVSDNGSGISREIGANLFQPHFTSKTTGTGLGLWLSRRIVERYGGTLLFRSSLRLARQGTSFRVAFPHVSSLSAI
jgi:signal transduction histidine kinase